MAIHTAIVPAGFGIVAVVVDSILFSVPFLSFDVPVSFANKLGEDHVESLVSSPRPRKVPEGRSRHARQHQNFHPYQFSFPPLELGGGIVDRKHPPRPAFFVAVPRRGLECIKAVLEMDNEWEFPRIVGRIGCIVGIVIIVAVVGVAADKIETVRKNLVVDTESLRGRRDVRVGHLWNGSRHSFHGLEMGLAHLVEISLGLLGTAPHLARFGLGTVALAEALRLDDAVAALVSAVPAFVFQKHGAFHEQMWGIIDIDSISICARCRRRCIVLRRSRRIIYCRCVDVDVVIDIDGLGSRSGSRNVYRARYRSRSRSRSLVVTAHTSDDARRHHGPFLSSPFGF